MIEVDKSPMYAAWWSLVRQIALVFGGWALGRGYLQHDTAAALGTIGAIAFPLIYGQIRGLINHRNMVELAQAAPNSIGKIKGT
jgi:hypothetical protein